MSFLKARKEMLNNCELYGISLDELKTRRTGKTTGIVFSIIGESLQNPEKPIKLWDHASNTPYYLSRVIARIIKETIKTNKLEGFTLNKANLTLTYSLEET